MSEKSARLALVGLLLFFAVSCTVWIVLIPFDRAPDEWTHYYYNVRFILDEGRLPIAGIDDLSAYQTHNEGGTGRLVARYSYAQAPALNYVIYAAGAGLGRVVRLDPITSARFVSLAFGLAFVFATYGAARSAGARPGIALAATAGAALNPQVQFLSSYINQEAFSLAAAACVVWALAADRRRMTRTSLMMLGAAIGWLLTAKLSFWVLLPFAGVYLARRVCLGGGVEERLTRTAVAAAGILAVSGFWLGRNLWLYGSVTAQEYVLALMRAAQGRIVEPTLGWSSLSALVERGFISDTFGSGLMRFDYMQLGLSAPHVYQVMATVLITTVIAVAIATIRARDRSLSWMGLCVLGIWMLALVLHAYNAVLWDYQPQGRYLFGTLAPTAVVAALIADRDRVTRLCIWTLAVAMLGLTAVTHRTVWRFYHRFDLETPKAARLLPIDPVRRVLGERRMQIEGDLASVGLVLTTLPEYDVGFYGIEVLNARTGEVLRRAYASPQTWRSWDRPGFRFPPIPASVREVRVRVIAESPGVRDPRFLTDCVRPWLDAGTPGLCMARGN